MRREEKRGEEKRGEERREEKKREEKRREGKGREENCAVLVITQPIVIIPYRRFGTTYLLRGRILKSRYSIIISHFDLCTTCKINISVS